MGGGAGLFICGELLVGLGALLEGIVDGRVFFKKSYCFVNVCVELIF